MLVAEMRGRTIVVWVMIYLRTYIMGVRPPGSCFGLCGDYDSRRPCQCNTGCSHNCCADYLTQCSHQNDFLAERPGNNGDGCGSVYSQPSTDPETFADAMALCGYSDGHLLFIETSEEQDYLELEGIIQGPSWLGITKVLGSEWYWTFANGSQIKATYTAWQFGQGLDGFGFVLGSGRYWYSDSPSSIFYVVCERDHCQSVNPTTHQGDSFAATSTQIQTASLVTSTPPTNLSTLQANICGTESRLSDLVSRHSLMKKISDGVWSYLPMSSAGSLLDCAARCLHTELCCHFLYDKYDHFCYWLTENIVSGQALVDCARLDHVCYTATNINP